MKKIVLLVIGLLFLSVIAIAYQVNIDAPETLTVGKPLIVTGYDHIWYRYVDRCGSLLSADNHDRDQTTGCR